MAINNNRSVKISNLRSKSFRGQTPDELDKAMNHWFETHTGSILVSMESHSSHFYCWVVILYRDKNAGEI